MNPERGGPSPEEMAEFDKKRILSDAELIRRGASFNYGDGKLWETNMEKEDPNATPLTLPEAASVLLGAARKDLKVMKKWQGERERGIEAEKAKFGRATGDMSEANSRVEGAERNLRRIEEMIERLGIEPEKPPKKQPEEREAPPEGWLNTPRFSKKTGKSVSAIKKIAEEFRSEHPEWFKSIELKKNVVSDFYSPELMEAIERRIKEPVPAGWEPNIHYGTFYKEIGSHLNGQAPGLVKGYFIGDEGTYGRGLFFDHMSPELRQPFEDEIERIKHLSFPEKIGEKELADLLHTSHLYMADKRARAFWPNDMGSGEDRSSRRERTYSALQAGRIRDAFVEQAEEDSITDPNRIKRAIRRTQQISMEIMERSLKDDEEAANEGY